MERGALELVLAGCEAVGAGRYRARWSLRNRSETPLLFHEVWIPHEKFRGGREIHDPPLPLEAGAAMEISQEVAFDPADAGLENSFVILRLSEGGAAPFRLFARLKVEVEGDAVLPRVVKVTTGV